MNKLKTTWPDHSVTRQLDQAKEGCSHSREMLGRWLLNHVRKCVEHVANQKPLPDSVSVIASEAVMKLLRSGAIPNAPNRAYLMGATTQAIIEVIATTTRHICRKKRTAPGYRIPEEQLVGILEADGVDIIPLTEAIEKLRQAFPRQSQVVVLRFFAGMKVSEVAEEMGISKSTVEADWRHARAWLMREIEGNICNSGK